MAYCVSGNYTISGCLGVGIDPAAYRLDLYTSGQSDGIRITSTSSKPMLRFSSTYNDASNRNWEMSPNGQVFGDFEIAQSAAKDGDAAGGDRNVRLYIKNDGNVGIGLTTPCGGLDVYKSGAGGSGTGDNLILRAGNSASSFGSNQLRFGFAGGIGYSHAIKSRHQSGSPNNNALDFFIWTTADAAETTGTKLVMTLDGTGNVGIGTCSPSTRLAVEGSGTDIETVARFNNQVNCTTRVWLRNSSHSAYWGLSSTVTADTLATGMVSGAMTMGFGNNYPIQFWNGSTATVKMTIGSDGNVGINTTTPGTYKLNVNGAFYAAGSSCEYKQSICQYNTDSCMFMKLKPVTYQYKDEWCHLGKELKSGTQIGLIAEDVAEVYPELAILKDEDDQKIVRNVDYEKLSIVLLSEVQKLRKELDELKTK